MSTAKFDLSLALGEQRGADGTPAGIHGELEYATDLFDRSTVEAIVAPAAFGCWRRRSPSPTGRSAALDVLSRRRAPQHAATDGTTPRVRSPQSLLPELFAAQAARTPDAVAVVFEDAELDLRASSTRARTGWRTG